MYHANANKTACFEGGREGANQPWDVLDRWLVIGRVIIAGRRVHERDLVVLAWPATTRLAGRA